MILVREATNRGGVVPWARRGWRMRVRPVRVAKPDSSLYAEHVSANGGRDSAGPSYRASATPTITIPTSSRVRGPCSCSAPRSGITLLYCRAHRVSSRAALLGRSYRLLARLVNPFIFHAVLRDAFEIADYVRVIDTAGDIIGR